MTDYKSMYFHLTGRMAGAVETLDATVEILEASTNALRNITEKLKLAQQVTEEMFINSDDEDSDA